MLIPSLSFLTAIAWSVTTTVSNITIITTAKFCVGFLTVLECAYVPLYIAKTCPHKYSGFCLSLVSITRNFSQIASSVASQAGLSFSLLTFAFGVVPSLLLALSAVVLAREEECEETKHNMRDLTIKHEGSFQSSRDKICQVKNIVLNLNKEDLLLLILASSYLLSGMVPLINFPSQLFKSSYPYSYQMATTTSLICNCVGSLASPILCSWSSQDMVLVTSSTVMSLSTAGLMLFYMFESCLVNPYLFCIPLVLVGLLFLSLGVGVGTIISVRIGEQLHDKSRTFLLTVVMVGMELLDAAQTFSFYPLQLALADYFLPFIFSFHTLANITTLAVVLICSY